MIVRSIEVLRRKWALSHAQRIAMAYIRTYEEIENPYMRRNSCHRKNGGHSS